MGSFLWTLDQYQRYAVLEEFLKVFYEGRTVRVLDVGGVSPDRVGQTFWLPLKKIQMGNSYVADLQFCQQPGFVQGNGLQLPFKARSFDVVSALDVIEHVAADQREAFIGEMARVSRSTVIISAPFKDEKLEQTEDILFKQIQELYGIEHQQLLEHRSHGLPEIETVDRVLSRHFTSRAGLPYGSLANWLFSQSLKNLFLLKRTTGEIQSLFDRWLACCDQEAEFSPPFSRYFWLAGKNINQEELTKAADKVKKGLMKKPAEKPTIGELSILTRAVTQLQSSKNVSALVFCFGNGETGEECFNHLLTQKIDFELEVMAVDLSEGQAAGKHIRERFPGVPIFTPEKNEELTRLLSRLMAETKTDYFLWMTDGIYLPQDSVGRMRRLLEEAPASSVLIPHVVKEGYDYILWGSRRKTPASIRRKILHAPRDNSKRNGPDFKSKPAGWVFSECLFFSKEALLGRDFSNQSLLAENIFLWAAVNPPGSFHYGPEVLVYKKGPLK